LSTFDKIDLVYTWVDGSLPGYLEERQQYSEKPLDMNPERYRDTFQTLKYSLRSVDMYLPWINNILIVTNRPQVPAWLNLAHPKVRIVHLDEFIPEAFLPTFCSNAIECFLHLLPGLSEHFIYMNDDFFFGKPTVLEDFWSDGKYTVFNTFFGENLKWRIYDQKNNIVGLGLIEHGPHFARKSYWQEMTEMLPDEVQATRSRKFRHPDNLVTFKLYRRYMLEKHRDISRAVPIWDFVRLCFFHKITNNFTATERGLRKINTIKPKFFCLNDDQRSDPNPEVVRSVKLFLDQYFPTPSPYER